MGGGAHRSRKLRIKSTNKSTNRMVTRITAMHSVKTCRCHHCEGQCFIYSFTALGFKAGKENVTTSSPGLFGCKKISFQTPFYGGQQLMVFASVGHTVKSQSPRNGATVWVEDVKASEFTVCILEFSNGSNNSIEVNYVAFETRPHGSQTGTTSLNSWTTGTECKRIDFQQVRVCFVKCLN